MKDTHGNELAIGDKIRRQPPHYFETMINPARGDVPGNWAGTGDPMVGEQIVGFAGSICVQCASGVYIAKTLEKM